MEKPARNKLFSLLGPLINDEEKNSFVNTAPRENGGKKLARTDVGVRRLNQGTLTERGKLSSTVDLLIMVACFVEK
jgi:hypothetical protein